MFYSHDILTSRKHGVATIWLIATLGSKSTLKKINRKDINEVNVSHACRVITSAEAPMALRLQSQLLYGVSRVYSYQCSYVLTDAQAIQSSINQAYRQMRADNEIDPNAGKTRPELLLLPDDPTFASNLELGNLSLFVDAPELDFSFGSLTSSQQSSLLLSELQNSSQTSSAVGGGIRIPTSDSAFGHPGGFADFNLGADKDTSTISRSGDLVRDALDNLYNDLRFSPDVDFGFDAEGNLYDIQPEPLADQAQVRGTLRSRASSDAAAIERVRREHENAQRGAQQRLEHELYMEDVQAMEDIHPLLPDMESSEAQAPDVRLEQEMITPPDMAGYDEGENLERAEEEEEEGEEEGSEYAVAAMPCRQRRRKGIKPDKETQIRTGTLNYWNKAYAENMAKKARQKVQKLATALAKNNAYYWVWGSGIGEFCTNAIALDMDRPFDGFLGEELMRRLNSVVAPTSGRKRASDVSAVYGEEEIEQDAARRTRRRTESPEERGRGVRDQETTELEAVDENLGAMGDEDVEIGREAPTPLPGDQSHERSSLALMPWNLSISRHSSNRPTQRRTGYGSQAGSVGSGTPMHSGLALPRRTGRLTSASPLLGRGQSGLRDLHGTLLSGAAETSSAYGLDDPVATGAGDDLDMPDYRADDEDPVGPAPTDTPGLFGERANQDQSGAPSVESRNFLEFVKRAIEDVSLINTHEGQQEPHEPARHAATQILFETLLPPRENSHIVAAQGLVQVLVLATKGFLHVVQEDGFGSIAMGVVAGVS